MIKMTIEIAQRVLMAYKGQSVSVEDCQNVFVNYQGEVIFLYNSFNFKKIGYFVSVSEFIVKGIKYQL